MNAEQIRDKFYEIAEKASTETATLIRELADLMYARLQNTTTNNTLTSDAIEALGIAFQELAANLNARMKTAENREQEQIQRVIDRVHNLGNRFMAVENKVDETVELIDLKLQEILEAVQLGPNDGSSTTTD